MLPNVSLTTSGRWRLLPNGSLVWLGCIYTSICLQWCLSRAWTSQELNAETRWKERLITSLRLRGRNRNMNSGHVSSAALDLSPEYLYMGSMLWLDCFGLDCWLTITWLVALSSYNKLVTKLQSCFHGVDIDIAAYDVSFSSSKETKTRNVSNYQHLRLLAYSSCFQWLVYSVFWDCSAWLIFLI